MEKLYLNIRKYSSIILILILISPTIALAQSLDIKGVIRDQNSTSTLSGVSIKVKDQPENTSTNESGAYSIKAKKGDVLIVSYVGYETKEVEVIGDQMDIALVQSDAELEEVIVVGYGTMKKSSVTSAISKIENKKLDQMPSGRVESALVGRLAGVSLSNNRNRPGEAPTIRIRGAGSISASNNPLVVIDGFPGGSLENLNMNDVESIEVLKDASAAAIYGSRGAGGVLLVTTKRGKSGKPKLNFNAYGGVSNAIKHDDWIYGQEFHDYVARYMNRDLVWIGGDPTLPLWGDERRPATYRVNPVVKEGNTDWEDVLLNPAAIQSYSLSVSGGTENVNYYVSGNVMDEDGTLINTGYRTYSARTNLDMKINSKIKAGIMLSPNYSKRRTAPVSMEAIVKTSPFVSSTQNPDGSWPRPRDYWGTTVSAQVSPLATLYGTSNVSRSMNSSGEAFATVDFIEGLSLRTSIGANISNSTIENFQAAYAAGNNLNSGSAKDLKSTVLVNENVLSFHKVFKEDHDFNAIVGASYQKSDGRTSSMAAIPGSFENEAIPTLNNAIINPAATETFKTQWGLASYFSRINYAYRGKYLLSASFRTDGSSRFGPKNRWGYFPSASVAWRVSEEDFLKDNPTISDLKIRASYGVVGNFNIGDFQYLGTIGGGYYSPGGQLTKGQWQTNFGNDKLKWEKTSSYDIGLELGVLNDRLSFVFDYYNKETKDLLYNVSIPAITGFTNSLTNIGKVSNKGIELEVSSKNLIGEFKWGTSFNLTKNVNKVVDLGGVEEVINTHTRGMSWVLKVGEPMFSYYGYKTIGVLMNDDDVANSPILPGSKPGHAKFKDSNNDGEITPADRELLGNYQPKMFLGMVNDFAWKNFDLTVVMQASLGAKVYNLENLYYQGATVSGMRRSLIENQWWSPEEPGDGKTPATALSALGYLSNSDFYLEDASFLSIRNINLGYTVPQMLSEKLKLANLRMYVSVNNLLMITKKEFHGYNPEGFTQGEIGGINSLPGFNNGAEPLNRTFAFGLNVNF